MLDGLFGLAVACGFVCLVLLVCSSLIVETVDKILDMFNDESK